MRLALSLASLLAVCIAAPATAKSLPRAVVAYASCVKANLASSEEPSATFDDAVQLAQSQCGNLRPAAVAAILKQHRAHFTAMHDDPEVGAQAYLDIIAAESQRIDWEERHLGSAG